ncbi:MAG: hypothetical protein GY870_15405 [archaeon]|nr:hypothetical protein [archaeon]
MFQEVAVKNSEDYYKKLELDPIQQRMIPEIAKILSQNIPMNDMALAGFIAKSMTDWQVKTSQKFIELANSSKEERMQIVTTLFDIMAQKLRTALKNESDEMRINSALNRALRYYIKKYLDR